jgi:hypothetical protein
MGNFSDSTQMNSGFNLTKLFKHTAFTHPRTFIRSIPRLILFNNEMKEHPQGRYLVKLAMILGHPIQYVLRKVHAKPLAVQDRFKVNPVQGYCKLDCKILPDYEKVQALCRRIFEERLPHFDVIATNQATGKDYMADFLYDEDLRDHPELIDFALNDQFLAMATEYLGGVPVLRRVTMFYSNNQNYEELIRSQLFHVDGEDIKQLKFFINLYDVKDEQDGPFSFLPADVTARFFENYRQKHGALPKSNRYKDSEVFDFASPSLIQKGLGEAGTGLAVDTSKCLHYGSRIAQGHFRVVFFMQYVSYHNLAECKLNTISNGRYKDDPVRKLALTPRISHPFAYYYKNPLLSLQK